MQSEIYITANNFRKLDNQLYNNKPECLMHWCIIENFTPLKLYRIQNIASKHNKKLSKC